MALKMLKVISIGLVTVPFCVSFPWMADSPNIKKHGQREHSRVVKRQTAPGCYAASCCPNNPVHPGAAPFNPEFPYLGANNGLPAPPPALGNKEVPHEGDVAHQFKAPGSLDIRGPCPGLNTMANHNFISHDGITNLKEMLDAQQNGWNVGYDLAMTLAVIGIGLTGDPITTKMSIGCDATSRTSILPGLLSGELGIDAHNSFEADASLSRSDYYLQQPDDFTFNTTLFAMMTKATGANYNLPNLVQFMSQRYDQSKADNPHFFFGPKIVLLYGATSFLFRLFPNFEPGTGNLAPANLENIGPFFGAVQTNTGITNPTFKFSGGERFPDSWNNRMTPLNLTQVAQDFLEMYALKPELLGGNVGAGNFDALGTAGDGVKGVTNSMFTGATTQDIICLFYQIATEDVPTSLTTKLGSLPAAVARFAAINLNPLPVFAGCPLMPIT